MGKCKRRIGAVNGGKGAKDRVVPLTAVACSFLESYINAIRPQLIEKKTSRRLFLSQRGRPIARNTLGGIAKTFSC
jgi:integrase/recombinase XerD